MVIAQPSSRSRRHSKRLIHFPPNGNTKTSRDALLCSSYVKELLFYILLSTVGYIHTQTTYIYIFHVMLSPNFDNILCFSSNFCMTTILNMLLRCAKLPILSWALLFVVKTCFTWSVETTNVIFSLTGECSQCTYCGVLWLLGCRVSIISWLKSRKSHVDRWLRHRDS